jgi:WD40 repeat protein
MRLILTALVIMSMLTTIVVAWQPEIDIDDNDGDIIIVTAFSPNGTLFVTGDSTGVIEIWDTRTFTTTNQFTAHTGYTRACTFSPDGMWLVTAGDDNEVKIWGTSNWTLEKTLTDHTDVPRSVDFSPDGYLMSSGGADQTVVVYNTTTWSSSRTLGGFSSTIVSTQFALNTSLSLIVAELSGTVTFFSTSAWNQTGLLSTSNGSIYSMDVSPNLDWLTTGHSDSTIRIENLVNGSVYTSTIHEGWVSDVEFSPNSSAVVSHSHGSNPGYVTWLDDPNTQVRLPMNSTVCASQGISFSPTGYRVAIPLCSVVSVLVMDSDGDNYTDPHDDCQTVAGNSTIDRVGCPDGDGDGYSNNTDVFPDNSSEWNDTDSDGIGDNGDDCPAVWGNSTQPVIGCPDIDGDGYDDSNDAFQTDPAEWRDSDGDGTGDNGDNCPSEWGNSTVDRTGCPDSDSDGWSDGRDRFPSDPSEWNDTDGDGFGDNSDDCPTEPGPIDGCPEQQNNNTNGTGNNTNGTGNNTNNTGNHTDPGNETGGNETGTNGTNNTGGNGTNGTGSNTTGENNNGTDPGSENVSNTSQIDNTGKDGGVIDAIPFLGEKAIFVVAAGFAALFTGVFISAITKRDQRGATETGGWQVFTDGPERPPITFPESTEEIPEFDNIEVPAVILPDPPSPPDPSRHVMEIPYTFDEQLDYIKQRIQPIVDESNRPLTGELKQLKLGVEQVYHDKEMGQKRRDRLVRGIEDVERGIEQLVPIRM